MGLEICAQEIVVDRLNAVSEGWRDLRQGYREHAARQIQQRQLSVSIQKRNGGRAITATDVQNSNEFAIPKKILDGLSPDIDIVAPALQIGLRGFEESFYFVDLGAHGVDDFPVSQSIIRKGYCVKVMKEQGGTDECAAVYPRIQGDFDE
jgi:hypothetical protein